MSLRPAELWDLTSLVQSESSGTKWPIPRAQLAQEQRGYVSCHPERANRMPRQPEKTNVSRPALLPLCSDSKRMHRRGASEFAFGATLPKSGKLRRRARWWRTRPVPGDRRETLLTPPALLAKRIAVAQIRREPLTGDQLFAHHAAARGEVA